MTRADAPAANCSIRSNVAPALLAARHGRRLTEQVSVVLTPSRQVQIDAVVAATARATMALEDVWTPPAGATYGAFIRYGHMHAERLCAMLETLPADL